MPYNLVNLLQKLGRIDEARELCESELAMCSDALGEAHQGTIDFVEQLAGLREAEARLAAPPPQMPAADQFSMYWIYLCVCTNAVGVRAGPEYPGDRTGDAVNNNEEVIVVERLTKTIDDAELTFLKLWVHPDDALDVERSGGWVFDQTPNGHTCMELVREVHPLCEPAVWVAVTTDCIPDDQELIAAARAGHADRVLSLLRGGARVDAIDWMGRTALHRAARYGHIATCSALLAADSRATTWTDVKGRTPQQEAARRGETALAVLLAAPDGAESMPSPAMRFAATDTLPPLRHAPSTSTGADAVDAALAYTPAQRRRFAEYGVHVFASFLSPHGLANASRRVDAIIASRGCDPRRLFNLHQRGEAWISRIATHPRVLDVARAHCGATFYFYLSHIIYKAPGSDYAVPWHQDYRYGADATPSDVAAELTAQRPCSLWIALDDVDAESGALRVLPCAHTLGALATADAGDVDFTAVTSPAALARASQHSVAAVAALEGEVPGVSADAADSANFVLGARALELRAGQALMQHPLLPHSSPPNRAARRWRRALLLRYKAGPGAQETVPPIQRSDDSWFQDHRSGELFRSVHALVSS